MQEGGRRRRGEAESVIDVRGEECAWSRGAERREGETAVHIFFPVRKIPMSQVALCCQDHARQYSNDFELGKCHNLEFNTLTQTIVS